jgi:ribosomal protein S27AE
METNSRKCIRCGKSLFLNSYKNEKTTCNICLEKGKENYINNREVKLQTYRDYRKNNLEKELERSKLYRREHVEELKVYRQKYQLLEHYCPICLYTVKLYKKRQHCKSLIHTTNIKLSEEQQQ